MRRRTAETRRLEYCGARVLRMLSSSGAGKRNRLVLGDVTVDHELRPHSIQKPAESAGTSPGSAHLTASGPSYFRSITIAPQSMSFNTKSSYRSHGFCHLVVTIVTPQSLVT